MTRPDEGNSAGVLYPAGEVLSEGSVDVHVRIRLSGRAFECQLLPVSLSATSRTFMLVVHESG